MKQEEQNKPSLQEEVSSLKRQLAGSKGRNKQLAEENRLLKDKISLLEGDNSKEVEQLRDALATANEQIANYKTEVHNQKIEVVGYKAMLEWYNELPWWKRVFVKKMAL